ncbi:MAG TPA: ATP-dependent DNA ligase [Candidatus Limnocylindrales bacterium]|jgi:DNA ligase 1|nr:ATP-dependent DNA ligase [Candidatus Limnocylindrales bacterium]
MRRWAEVAQSISATSRTSHKTALLAEYLRSLEPEELAPAVTFLTGRPFAQSDQRTLGLGWAAIAGLIEGLAGSAAGALGAEYNRSSDLATAVGDLLAGHGHQPAGEPPSVAEVAAAFGAIAEARGAAAKAELMRRLLERSDPQTARAIVRVLSGDMRIGLRSGHLEAAVAAAFDVPLADVQWAGMLTGDMGQTALLARRGALAEAELVLFRPLKTMLASPVADEAEAFRRLGAPVWVEDKYDGIRAQLHKQGREIRLYTRDLKDVTSGYPEIVEAAAGQPWDGILDGELLGWRDGQALPFLQLQTRLGRKKPPPALLEQVPVIYVAFDALALSEVGAPAKPLLRQPLSERRARLEALRLPETAGFGIAQLIRVADEEVLRATFDEARVRGNEGLMVKDPDSIYTPGRRGFGWLKLKKALTTLDCVVVGVEVGHGKRHGVLSDYTFAVINDQSGSDGRLVTIGKAYSGLTDAEIADMTEWFRAHTVRQLGRFHVVEPTVVVEVAFDVIHRSARHDSGFALRFPRIHRLRPDKGPHEVDTLSTVERLHAAYEQGGKFRVITHGERGAG